MLANCYSPDARNWRSIDAGVDAAMHADAAHDAAHDAAIDAAPDAAAVIIDAPLPVEVHLQVTGGGEIALGSQTCEMDCTYPVPYASSVTLEAIASPKQKFDGWTTSTCAGQPTVCTFIAHQSVTIGARFVKAD